MKDLLVILDQIYVGILKCIPKKKTNKTAVIESYEVDYEDLPEEIRNAMIR